MMKEPRAGRVKTRLGRDIGMTDAAWWFRHQSRRLIRTLQDPRWQIVIAVAPDTALLSRAWPRRHARMGQGSGDLGKRMRRIFNALPRGPVVLVGGDIPGITPNHIDRAFRALGGNDVVFGPATDGGYWLVGMKRHRKHLAVFKDVRWSTEHALADTVKSLPDAKIAFVDMLNDVDTGADLSP